MKQKQDPRLEQTTVTLSEEVISDSRLYLQLCETLEAVKEQLQREWESKE